MVLFQLKTSQIVPVLKLVTRTKYYLTTPIFYVNAKPHIGHLYTALLADAVSRHHHLQNANENVFFMTGTDEHGLKIQSAAKKWKTPEIDYVNNISNMYKDLFKKYNISHTDYLRTTEDRHSQCVQKLWLRLFEDGHIYLGEYAGWYCLADEAFIPESQLETKSDGTKVTIDGKRPVEFIQEKNYKFRLSSFKEKLLQWLRGDVVRPKKFHKLLQDWIEEGDIMEDISVSRPRKRVSWGIPVPNDTEHTIYVWLDALSCYLTSAGYPSSLRHWPPDLQIIGKDILKFHGVYWPSFLIGAGLSPPKQLLCHSHWLVNDEKMSKSRGNVIDPHDEAEKYTVEGFRYFLLREGTPHSDGNYSSIKIKRIVNSELADTLGNLLNRCTGSIINPNQIFPSFNEADHLQYCVPDAEQLLESTESLPDKVNEFYSNFEFYKGIDEIQATLRLTNALFERSKPWELSKNADKASQLSSILHVTMESLRVCGILLYPIVPELSTKLLDRLNIPLSERFLSNARQITWQKNYTEQRLLASKKATLFQRLK